jgi:hypothetical protein
MSERTRYLRETLNPCDKICEDDNFKIYSYRKSNINLNMQYSLYESRQNKAYNQVKSSSQLNNHDKSLTPFCNEEGKICKPWHNQSDRKSTKNGQDIKHNHYDRYLRRLKGSILTKI